MEVLDYMFKKLILPFLLVLLSLSMGHAASFDGVDFLAGHGFSVTQDENFFVIKSPNHPFRPFLIVEKLPSYLVASEQVKIKHLNNLGIVEKDEDANIIKFQSIMSDNIRNNMQKAYVLAVDANCDGLFDSVISPEYRFGDFLDRNIRAKIYKYYYRFDNANTCRIVTWFRCYMRFNSLMPLFMNADIIIRKNFECSGKEKRYSSSFKNIHDSKFTVSNINVKANPDGNLTITLKDKNNFSSRAGVKLQTNFKWE